MNLLAQQSRLEITTEKKDGIKCKREHTVNRKHDTYVDGPLNIQ